MTEPAVNLAMAGIPDFLGFIANLLWELKALVFVVGRNRRGYGGYDPKYDAYGHFLSSM